MQESVELELHVYVINYVQLCEVAESHSLTFVLGMYALGARVCTIYVRLCAEKQIRFYENRKILGSGSKSTGLF